MAKKVNRIDLSAFDKKKAVKKMIASDLDEVKSLILFLLDEDEEELETHYKYTEVKVTTDKACIFGFSVISGANANFGGAEVVKGANEVVGGVASAPESAGAGIAIAAKGGIELKKGVEKLDRSWDFGKKAKNAYKQYNLDKETLEDCDTPKLYRSMKEDSGIPKIEASARALGARPNTDIPIDENGMVHPNIGGISTSPSPYDLPEHRRPAAYGGTGKDPVWSIDINDLGPDLKYVPDSPKHGTIQPTRVMTVEEYQEALVETVLRWELN